MIYEELLDLEDIFNNLTNKPVMLNDLLITSEEKRQQLSNLILTKYKERQTTLSIPSCTCGETVGQYRVGDICPSCDTEVTNNEHELEPSLWYRAPDDINKLFNPQVWWFLTRILTVTNKGLNILLYLTDTSYKIPPTTALTAQRNIDVICEQLDLHNIERGYNYFVDNFFDIMTILIESKHFIKTDAKKKMSKHLLTVLNDNKDRIFTTVIPFPNKFLNVLEKASNKATYIEKTLPGILNSVNMLVNEDTGNRKTRTTIYRQNRISKFYNSLTTFYEGSYKSMLLSKPGLFRKHVFGARANFTFRCVISSITAPHEYDTIYMPWCVAMTVLRAHLMNKLLKMNYSHNEAIAMIYEHVYKYNVMFDDIFKELIETSPRKGLIANLTRNPSLTSGSSNMCRITKVKTDPKDMSISLSILAVNSLNADTLPLTA